MMYGQKAREEIRLEARPSFQAFAEGIIDEVCQTLGLERDTVYFLPPGWDILPGWNTIFEGLELGDDVPTPTVTVKYGERIR